MRIKRLLSLLISFSLLLQAAPVQPVYGEEFRSQQSTGLSEAEEGAGSQARAEERTEAKVQAEEESAAPEIEETGDFAAEESLDLAGEETMDLAGEESTDLAGEESMDLAGEKSTDLAEEETMDGALEAGLVPVYAHGSGDDRDSFVDMPRIRIGYAKLDRVNRTAKFYDACGNSESPSDRKKISIPRRLVVSDNAVFDYTYGHYLDPDGYATLEQWSTWTPEMKENPQDAYYVTKKDYMYDEYGNLILDENEDPVEYTYRLYIGEAYDVTEVDKDVFHAEDFKFPEVEVIEMPNTIITDLDYTFFTDLISLREFNVYEPQGYNSYYVNGMPIPDSLLGRYVSQGNDSKYKTGDEIVYTSGVLVDLWDKQVETANGAAVIASEIIFCPPRYANSKYNYYADSTDTALFAIGPHAFENCASLEMLEPLARWKNTGQLIYDNHMLYEIGEEAFAGCSALNDINIFYDKLTYIGDRAFSGCTSLSEIELHPSNGTKLGHSVFEGTAIQRLDIPVGYNEMDGETFLDMDALSEINVVPGDYSYDDAINQYFTSMDGVLFRYCQPLATKFDEPKVAENGLELVRYPSMCVTSAKCPDASANIKSDNSFFVPYYTKGFDEYCFYKCNMVQNMYFPSTIRSVGLKRFFECENLTHVYFYSGLPDFEIAPEDYTNYPRDYISFDDDENAVNDFFGHPKRYMYVHAGTGTPIYEYALANHGAPLYLMYNDRNGNPLYDIENYVFNITYTGTDSGTATLTGFDLPEGSTYVHVVVPDLFERNGVLYTVDAVDSGALANPDIESVTFLHDMKRVAQDAFYTVVNRDDISDDRNSHSEKLANVYVEEGNFYLGTVDGVLYSLVKNKKTGEYEPSELIYYPVGNPAQEYTTLENIVVLPEFAFWGAKNLKEVNIFDSVQEIGYNYDKDVSDEHMSFEGCVNLVKVNILHSDSVRPENIRYYSDNGVLYQWDPNEGLYGAPVTLVFYPYGRRELAEDETSPVSYVVADGCLEVRYVKNCPYLSGISFPRTVRKIDDLAFEGTMALTSIEFKDKGAGTGIQYIGERAFAFTDIRALDIPSSIIRIENEAFYDCNSIETIRIAGDNLIKIGDGAFFREPGSLGSSQLLSVDIICEKTNESGGNLTVGESAFEANELLKSVTIRNMGTTVIGNRAFYGASSLRTVDFKDTNLVGLGNRSFQNCKDLTYLDLSDMTTLLEISPYTFYGDILLEDVLLPESIERIGNYAFKNCVSLVTFNFEQLPALLELGYQAFANTGFISVQLPKNLITMGDSVFIHEDKAGTSLLSTIYVPQTVIFKNSEGKYDAKNGSGPFYNYGPDTYVYGVEGSDVQYYLEFMKDKGYSVPTFVGSEEMPVAIVDLKESEIDVYDVGEVFPTLTCVVSSQDDLRDYSVSWYVMDPKICYVTGEKYDNVDTSTCEVHPLSVGSTRVFAINRQTGAFDYCTVNVKSAKVDVNPKDNVKDDNLQTVNGMTLPKSIILNSRGSNTKSSLNATSDPPRKIYYKSNDKKVVRVNKKGLAIGRKAGTTTIIAYAGEADTYVEAEVEVTVFRPEIKLDNKRLTMNSVGDPEDLYRLLHVTHSGAYEEVTWESSNPRICTVEGDNDSAVVRAVNAGTATVTATCNGIKAKCRVVIAPATVALDTTSLMLYTGQTTTETHQLKARVTGLKKNISWSSDHPEIATVSSRGLVTAVDAGTAVITATCNGVEARCNVRVTRSSLVIYGGETGDSTEAKTEIMMNKAGDLSVYQLKARIVGRNDKVVWKSGATNIVTVDKEGVVSAKSGGSADIFAYANGDEAVCTVTVIDNYTELDYSDVTLFLNGSSSDKVVTLTASIEGADPSKRVTWEVEDPEILRVGANTGKADFEETDNGGKSMCTFTALKEGETRIKVTSNGITAFCKVKVKN